MKSKVDKNHFCLQSGIKYVEDIKKTSKIFVEYQSIIIPFQFYQPKCKFYYFDKICISDSNDLKHNEICLLLGFPPKFYLVQKVSLTVPNVDLYCLKITKIKRKINLS